MDTRRASSLFLVLGQSQQARDVTAEKCMEEWIARYAGALVRRLNRLGATGTHLSLQPRRVCSDDLSRLANISWSGGRDHERAVEFALLESDQ